MERSSSERIKRNNRGSFENMRGYRRNPPTDELSIIIDRQSCDQISQDVRHGVHKFHVKYWGVVSGNDIPDLTKAKVSPNCKDQSYNNYLLFGGVGEMELPIFSWYIIRNF